MQDLFFAEFLNPHGLNKFIYIGCFQIHSAFGYR